MQLSAAKKIAVCAMTAAILIAVQAVFGFVSGIEVVTVLLLSFSAYFGAVCGMISAVAFSILRCFIWGFYPSVIVLYLIYYPLFALLCGILGRVSDEKIKGAPVFVCINVSVGAVGACAAVAAALNLIKISRLYAATLNVFLWVLAGVCAAFIISFDGIYVAVKLKRADVKTIRTFMFAAAAVISTILFTLLDDVITPLMSGMGKIAALGYFYTSFLAMLPQTVCAAVSVLALYPPITFALTKACRSSKFIDKKRKKF